MLIEFASSLPSKHTREPVFESKLIINQIIVNNRKYFKDNHFIFKIIHRSKNNIQMEFAHQILYKISVVSENSILL